MCKSVLCFLTSMDHRRALMVFIFPKVFLSFYSLFNIVNNL
jgi:hypothetical protein